MYANLNKIHGYILVTCTFFALISPDYNQEIVQAKPKEKTSSWVEREVHAPVSSTGEVDRKEKTDSKVDSKWSWVDKLTQGTCWVDCKQKQLEKAWINPNIAPVLIAECKKQDIEVVNCIKIWASILWAESSGWNRCSKLNCFWVLWKSFNSYEESVQDWVKRFWKYWYKQKNPSAFYSDSKWRIPKTKYCMSESSSWSSWFCPNWAKHAWTVFNRLDF